MHRPKKTVECTKHWNMNSSSHREDWCRRTGADPYMHVFLDGAMASAGLFSSDAGTMTRPQNTGCVQHLRWKWAA